MSRPRSRPHRRFRPVRLAVWLGLLVGVAYLVRRATAPPTPASETGGWRAVEPPAPAPPRPLTPVVPIVEPTVVEVGDVDRPGEPEVGTPSVAWVDPEGKVCPTSHPIKAKLGSKIFHLPGMLAYDRTTPDRCYASEAAAEADGLRRAKR